MGAELLIASLETPITPEELAVVIAAAQPGLAAEVAYFVVPLEGPQPAGSLSLRSGVDEFVSQLAAVLAGNGQVGAELVVIHAIGFLPAGNEQSVSDALQTLIDSGFKLYLCVVPVVGGGCNFPPP